MNIKHITLSALVAFTSLQVKAQDLERRIPLSANVIVCMNNASIVKNSSEQLLIEGLSKINGLQDQGESKELLSKLDLGQNAYMYFLLDNQSQYTGFLAAITPGASMDLAVFEDYSTPELVNGYKKRVSPDGTTYIAYDDNSILIVSGTYVDEYFSDKQIAKAYGLEVVETSDIDWDYYDSEQEVEEATAYADATEEEQTIPYASADGYGNEPVLEAKEITPEYLESLEQQAEVNKVAQEVYEASAYDTINEQDTSSDQYESTEDENAIYIEDQEWMTYNYVLTPEQEAKNDSIKVAALASWMEIDFPGILNPDFTQYDIKAFKTTKDSNLARIYLSDFNDFYQKILPGDIFNMVYNVDINNLDYGFKDATIDLNLKDNTLFLDSKIKMDKDLTRFAKTVTKIKPNRRFAKYIPQNYMGLTSINVSTKGYLSEIPFAVQKFSSAFSEDKFYPILATGLDILLDQKAIAKVAPGNVLVFYTGLKEVTREYVTYDYDEDYNYIEVPQTKQEHLPEYLWMFTSKDQRIFKAVTKYMETTEDVSCNDGIYSSLKDSEVLPTHILFKDDIVFIATDLEQLRAIKNGTFNPLKDASVKKQIFSSVWSASVNVNEISEITEKLEIPLLNLDSIDIKELSKFGTARFTVDKIKNKTISSSLSIAFPKEDQNALNYLLKKISNSQESTEN